MSENMKKISDEDLNLVTGGTEAVAILDNAGASRVDHEITAVKVQDPAHSLPCVCTCGKTYYIANRGSHNVVCPYCKRSKQIYG